MRASLAAERRLLNRMIVDCAGDRSADAGDDPRDANLDQRRRYRTRAGGAPDRYKDVVEVAGHDRRLNDVGASGKVVGPAGLEPAT